MSTFIPLDATFKTENDVLLQKRICPAANICCQAVRFLASLDVRVAIDRNLEYSKEVE